MSWITIFYKKGLSIGAKEVSDGYEGLQNRLDIRYEDLREEVSLYKRSLLTRSIDKD